MPRGIDTSRHPARKIQNGWTPRTNSIWPGNERLVADHSDEWGDYRGTVGVASVTSLGGRYGARASLYRGDPEYGDVTQATGRSGGYRTMYRAQVAAESLRSRLGQDD